MHQDCPRDSNIYLYFACLCFAYNIQTSLGLSSKLVIVIIILIYHPASDRYTQARIIPDLAFDIIAISSD